MVSRATMHENLIEAVREHEVLYNSDMKEYNDNILKMRLWRMIARKCDIPSGEEAKKIWKNLRDGFRCSIKTLKLYANKEPPRALKPWKYAEQMEFLRPFMKDRVFSNAAYYETEFDYDSSNFDMQMDNTQDSTLGSGDNTHGSNENTHGSMEETIECRPDIEIIPPSILQQTLTQSTQLFEQPTQEIPPSKFGLRIEMIKREMEEEQEQPSLSVPVPGMPAVLMAPQDLTPVANLAPPPKKRGRKRRSELPDNYLDTQVKDDNEESPEDSLKLFFDSMYATARALPPQLQRVIRIKLFQAVTDAEIAAESMDLYTRNPVSALNHVALYGQTPNNTHPNIRRT